MFVDPKHEEVESDEEQSVTLSIRNDFQRAVKRPSFQRSMTSSSRSGDLDIDISAALLSMSDELHSDDDQPHQERNNYQDLQVQTKQPSEEETKAESSTDWKQKGNSRIRRRATAESSTTMGRSAVSSLDSFASPIDFARVRQIAGKNQVTNGATTAPPASALPQPLPPIEREKSTDSMSSLGEESVFRQITNYQSDQINRTEDVIPTINEHEDDDPRKLAQRYLEKESNNCNVSIAEEDLDRSRRDYHYNEFEQSEITLGTFFSEIQGTHISEYMRISTSNNCDLDSGMAAFTIAMKLGHFDCHYAVMANVNTENDDDECLAAKAFMGLGFAGQQKGENESALDSYRQSLQLWESGIGSEHPALACLHYTIGTVLSHERNELEASVHFNNALTLLKSNKTISEPIRASILSTEGMIFSVLGEAIRAIDCFKRALSIYHKMENPLNLNYSLLMYEMGTLLAQQGDLGDAVSCYKFALDIREKKLGNSFVVMQTHYSLGVTLAQTETSNSMEYALIHLEKALSLCGDDNIQAPTIIHAMGVLCEKKGDFHAASSWFYRELSTVKALFGDGK
jgi:tetratricopeptide (TPR) repeat protein